LDAFSEKVKCLSHKVIDRANIIARGIFGFEEDPGLCREGGGLLCCSNAEVFGTVDAEFDRRSGWFFEPKSIWGTRR
jgi:hypothetical protein